MIHPTSALIVRLVPALLAATPTTAAPPARICLAPARVEAATGDANTLVNAVRETLTSFLTGPSLEVKPLNARLESQAREEARQGECPYVLFTTVKHVQKRHTNKLSRMAGAAAEEAAYSTAVRTNGAAGAVAADAIAGAARVAAYDYAVYVKNKDELTLSYQLEGKDGAVLVEKSEKRKADADGEDLLTPIAEKVAETVAAAVSGSGS